MVTQTTKAANGTEVLERERLRHGPTFRPDVDIYETQEQIAIVADMPGASPDAVDIRFENGLLTIHGRVEPRQPEDCDFLIQEYGVGDYLRTFQVSEDIDVSAIGAELSDGVLTVHLPKAETAKPRRIPVRAQPQGQRQVGASTPSQPPQQRPQPSRPTSQPQQPPQRGAPQPRDQRGA